MHPVLLRTAGGGGTYDPTDRAQLPATVGGVVRRPEHSAVVAGERDADPGQQVGRERLVQAQNGDLLLLLLLLLLRKVDLLLLLFKPFPPELLVHPLMGLLPPL